RSRRAVNQYVRCDQRKGPATTERCRVMVKGALLSAAFFAIFAPLVPPPALAQSYSLTAGTILHCRLNHTLSTRVNYLGDSFAATISEPALLNGHEVIPAGATLEGKVTQWNRPGRVR